MLNPEIDLERLREVYPEAAHELEVLDMHVERLRRRRDEAVRHAGKYRRKLEDLGYDPSEVLTPRQLIPIGEEAIVSDPVKLYSGIVMTTVDSYGHSCLRIYGEATPGEELLRREVDVYPWGTQVLDETCANGLCVVSEAVVSALLEVGPWEDIDGEGDAASVLADHIRLLPRVWIVE